MGGYRISIHVLAYLVVLLTLLATSELCPAAPGDVEGTVAAMVGKMQRICDPLLTRPDVSEEDKAQVRSLLKTIQDAGAKAITDFGKGTPQRSAEGVGPMNWLEAYSRIEKAQSGLGTFLQTRPDLNWISHQAEVIRQFEPDMLESRPNVYLDLLKQLGLDDAKLGQAKKSLDLLKEELSKAEAQVKDQQRPDDSATNYKLVSEFYAKKLAHIEKTRDTLRAMLTPDQQARLIWQFPDVAPSGPRPVRYSRQVAINKAPLAGKYFLAVYSATTLRPDPVFSGTLEQGDAIGFRKSDKGVVAIAGSKEIPLPDAKAIYFWAWEQDKP